MHTWRFILAGMLVWTVHFFGSYILASTFTNRVMTAGALAAVLTFACLAALVQLSRRSIAGIAQDDDELSGWSAMLATLLNAAAFVAVLWQAFPIIFVNG